MNFMFDKCSIRDGITLSALKTEKFKTTALKLNIVMPATVDERDAALFALLINVLRCGTEKYPEKADIIRRLGDLYDSSCSIGGYASGDNRILEISADMLSDRFSDEGSILDGVTDLMNQLLYHPNVDQNGLFHSDTVEREKQVICDRIKSEKNNSRAYALKQCRKIMCDGEPFGISVKAEAVKAIGAEELTEYYKTFLSRAVPTFSYVGDRETAEVAEIIKKHFENETVGAPVPILPLSCNSVKEVKRMDEELEIKQGILVMGFRNGVLLGEEYADAMRVFNNILGGTSTSRLFAVIREKMGLCYYCDSDYSSTKGFLFICSGIDTDKREIVESSIFEQLDLLKHSPVGEDELKSAKDMAIKELREISDYQLSIASFRYTYDVYGYECDIDKIIDRISSVTSDDILAIAQKLTLDTVFFLKGNGNCEENEEDDEDE